MQTYSLRTTRHRYWGTKRSAGTGHPCARQRSPLGSITSSIEAETAARVSQARSRTPRGHGRSFGGLRLFDDFTHVELIDTRWIEPLVSEKAVAGYAGYDEKLRPVLARKPLEQAENNYAEALLL